MGEPSRAWVNIPFAFVPPATPSLAGTCQETSIIIHAAIDLYVKGLLKCGDSKAATSVRSRTCLRFLASCSWLRSLALRSMTFFAKTFRAPGPSLGETTDLACATLFNARTFGTFWVPASDLHTLESIALESLASGVAALVVYTSRTSRTSLAEDCRTVARSRVFLFAHRGVTQLIRNLNLHEAL